VGEHGDGLERAAGANELLSAARFQEELRRISRLCPRLAVGDPLAAAVRRIEQNPAFAQSRLLTRILSALIYQKGDFRRAEVAALDAQTLAMVIALMDAHTNGTSTREEWMFALDAAKAAELSPAD
jgi:hypothetical protein